MDVEKCASGQHVNKSFSGESDEYTVYSKDFDPELLQIESLSIVNSSSVQFGNNFYSGPVTINHIQPTTQTETSASESTEKDQNVDDIRQDKAWYHRLFPKSKRQRSIIGVMLVLGLLSTVVCTSVLVTQITSTQTLNFTDEWTKPSNESFDLDPNRTYIYERSVWTSRKPRPGIETLKTPVPLVIIAHSATPTCNDFEGCTRRIRGFQEYHMDTQNYSDIGYNFLIGGDGHIYEGRGWDKEGAHTGGFNRNSTGICVVGNFEITQPTPQQVASVHKLIELGVQLRKISPDYRVVGQRQVRDTQSPGKNLFALMTAWPHFGLRSSK